MQEELEEIRVLRTRVSTFWCVFDEAGRKRRIVELDEQAGKPELWNDPERAQALLRELSDLRSELEPWQTLAKQLEDADDLLGLAIEEKDEAIGAEMVEHLPDWRRQLDSLEFQLTLSGPYDRGNAILSIHAGAGGTDAQDWAQILMRMYLRWAENRRFKTEIYDMSPGEEAGMKSVTVEIAGPFAYGYLRSERGVHRLVRLSPYDSAHRRHTSFSLVEVAPDVDNSAIVQVDPEDVKFEAYRAGGPGGQNVNKVSTAVRLTHVPSGIVVTCQTERSQLQNRETAMRILRAKLVAIEAQRRDEERLRLRGAHIEAGWGNQIRSYVVHPYNMVKDLRTGFESSDSAGVLEGDLDGFMQAYLAWSVNEGLVTPVSDLADV
ncbi:MAG: peptide chain release factor 2 [Chloroflexi bacterium]|nr:peptide chain release factor 2 [Chloroflexota bacterium]